VIRVLDIVTVIFSTNSILMELGYHISLATDAKEVRLY
jgi:hypothetical protein